MNELEILLTTYTNAVFEKDTETFLSLFDEDVRIFDMWGSWSYDGHAAWREMVTGWFASLGADRDRVTFEEVKFFFSGDLATVTAFARFAAVSSRGEELRFLYNRITLVVRRDGSEAGSNAGPNDWKIIHQHTSAPIDGTLNAILKR